MAVKSPIRKMTGMPEILQLAHLVEHHGVPKMQVGGRWVQSEFDAQRLAGGFGPCELAHEVLFDKQFVASTQRDGQRLTDGR